MVVRNCGNSAIANGSAASTLHTPRNLQSGGRGIRQSYHQSRNGVVLLKHLAKLLIKAGIFITIPGSEDARVANCFEGCTSLAIETVIDVAVAVSLRLCSVRDTNRNQSLLLGSF